MFFRPFRQAFLALPPPVQILAVITVLATLILLLLQQQLVDNVIHLFHEFPPIFLLPWPTSPPRSQSPQPMDPPPLPV